MWQEFLKDYFNFTKKERLGIIVFFLTTIIILSVSFFSPSFSDEPVDHTQFEKEIAQLKIDSAKKFFYNSQSEYYNDYLPNSLQRQNKRADVFFFDPNTASVNDWVRLGLKEKTALTIQKYISKGGKFYKANDIKKIYGLRAADAERLIPYVSIKATAKESTPYEKREYQKTTNQLFTKTNRQVDINLADTSAYISLPGIGSKLAKRIVDFREKLGGFYSIEQVSETYFLPDSTFQKIKPLLIITSANPVKQININTASAEEMKLHPYIKYNLANAIFQYRKQHGNFNSVEEIKKIMFVTDDVYGKAAPYLSVK